MECMGCQTGEKVKLKSGKFVKTNIDIKKQEQWPHVNVLRKYTRKCSFDNMDFEMFVAGETRIILNMTEPGEARGMLKLLSTLGHWLCRYRDWGLVKGLYEGIIESVELGESLWTDDFNHYETMIPLAHGLWGMEKSDVEGSRRNKERKLEVFRCKAFQKNNCTEKAPHMAHIKMDEPPVPVLHVCASCLQKENRREEHSELDCPAKK